jgi:TetR/AcrR family transcriptional repressor of nem operon
VTGTRSGGTAADSSGIARGGPLRADTARTATRNRILDIAERLVQQRGFNGFSYADVARELGLTKPALHYHFANKSDLGTALITRYTDRFLAALALFDAERASGAAKLEGYVDLYRQVVREERMCLCGMLAAEYRTLPDAMGTAVRRFFDDNERWLDAAMTEGERDGTLTAVRDARAAARMVISCLQGATLVSRPYGDTAHFEAAAQQLLAGLRTAAGELSTI